MPLFRVSFEFEGTKEQVERLTDTINARFDTYSSSGPVDVHAEWREELAGNGFSAEQVDYLVDARMKVDQGLITDVDDLQERLGFGVVDEAVLRDTFFKD